MGREVKYRAWDGTRWFHVISLHFLAKGVYIEGWTDDSKHFAAGFVGDVFKALVQFTGLKDSKGVEIYEGDVVRSRGTFISRTPQQKEVRGADVVQTDEIGVITWDEEGADYNLSQLDNQTIEGFPLLDARYEVLGNVHQTPSLLEENR